MNESYYNNSTENITSSNHCIGLLIEYVSDENNLHGFANDRYIRGMNNNKTDNKNNNNISDVTKVNKNDDHHLGEKDQIKTKKLLVNEKNKVFVLGDSLVKHIQGWDITKKQGNKRSKVIRMDQK